MLRHDLRRRRLALCGLVLILVLGGGATLGALVLAHRTDLVAAAVPAGAATRIRAEALRAE